MAPSLESHFTGKTVVGMRTNLYIVEDIDSTSVKFIGFEKISLEDLIKIIIHNKHINLEHYKFLSNNYPELLI